MSFCKYTLKSSEEISEVFFFTAFYPTDCKKKPGRRARHEAYNKALISTGVQIVLGEFRKKGKWCSVCGQNSHAFEEKETDVNIAVEAMNQAWKGVDKIVVISGDSDCVPIYRFIQNKTESEVSVIFPPNRTSNEVRNLGLSCMKMTEAHLKNFQLPSQINYKGLIINKPS